MSDLAGIYEPRETLTARSEVLNERTVSGHCKYYSSVKGILIVRLSFGGDFFLAGAIQSIS
jgi:hypothetical protein